MLVHIRSRELLCPRPLWMSYCEATVLLQDSLTLCPLRRVTYGRVTRFPEKSNSFTAALWTTKHPSSRLTWPLQKAEEEKLTPRGRSWQEPETSRTAVQGQDAVLSNRQQQLLEHGLKISLSLCGKSQLMFARW